MGQNKREQWGSKFGFIMSSAGAAIGLGAIWKFPYVTGMSGGGAFLMLFILFTILIGLPLVIAEFIIGRGAQTEAVSAYRKLSPKSSLKYTGALGVVGSFLLLSFYSVIGGWVLIYSILALGGRVIGNGADYPGLFERITGTPTIALLGLAAFLLINIAVVSLGIQNGIEKASKYMMPLLFVFFVMLVIRSLTLEGAMEGVRFFLYPDFSAITRESVLYALGHSFFALAVGFSVLVTYSSYLGRDVSLPSSANSVAFMNIFVSLLAGLAIFPVVFAFGMEPAQGPGLLFMVLPAVFSQLPFGELFLAGFLILFLFATLTSSFSMLEIIVSALTAGGKRTRRASTWSLGVVLFFAGIPAALSFNVLEGVLLFGRSIFDLTDFLVSNILLPLGCLLISLFVSRRMDPKITEKEFMVGSISSGYYIVWRFLIKWIVPATIILVFLNSLGIM
ncbi:hypothetical protein GJU40_18270 [Bacillus lacus]|uniref:Transporter n=1 Tax=Metabacillus lacus TaxID=1983721 RepID=A0A7X2J255_9BACI|nr:hypothetical protein [Metabacillus lacus]